MDACIHPPIPRPGRLQVDRLGLTIWRTNGNSDDEDALMVIMIKMHKTKFQVKEPPCANIHY